MNSLRTHRVGAKPEASYMSVFISYIIQQISFLCVLLLVSCEPLVIYEQDSVN